MTGAFEEAVREEAAYIMGREVSDATWSEMYGRAQQKLRHIVTRYGDADGARNTVNYIAQLTVEAIRAQALADYTAAMYEAKSKGAGTTADPQGHTNIILHGGPKSQAPCSVRA